MAVDVKQLLTKEIAGIPVAAWLAVVAGALVVGYFVNQRRQSSVDVSDDVTGPRPGAGAPSGGSSDPGTPGGTSTNDQWRRQAHQNLVARGLDAGDVDRALRRYLAGDTLTAQESAIVSQALTLTGPPPENVPLPSEPTPPEPPGTLPSISELVITNTGPTSIALDWNPVPGVSSYRWRVVSSGMTGQFHAKTLTGRVDDGGTSASVAGINPNVPQQVTIWTGDNPTPFTRTFTHMWGSGGGTSAPHSNTPTAPARTPRTHTVSSGETLGSIALRYYGAATRWLALYNANSTVIEQTARSNGKTSSNGGPTNQAGWWLFPGTVLIIPQ